MKVFWLIAWLVMTGLVRVALRYAAEALDWELDFADVADRRLAWAASGLISAAVLVAVAIFYYERSW